MISNAETLITLREQDRRLQLVPQVKFLVSFSFRGLFPFDWILGYNSLKVDLGCLGLEAAPAPDLDGS